MLRYLTHQMVSHTEPSGMSSLETVLKKAGTFRDTYLDTYLEARQDGFLRDVDIAYPAASQG